MKPTLRRTGARVLLALTVGVLFFELGLRALLTSPWTRDSELARKVGHPARFAFSHEDLYWRFVRRLGTHEAPSFEAPYDPSLGWTWPRIEPGTYAHAEEYLLEGRRPVLFFGDSYSACLTPREDCFDGLLERGALASRCQLLNYGVCGYGFDQTCLLAQATVERFADRDPVVVIGLLVDDDLRRMLLSQREYPKPRLRVEDGRVLAPQAAVPSLQDMLSAPQELPWFWSWTWLRKALRRDPLSVAGSPERLELEELTRALLRELVTDLRTRELDHFFLLFHVAKSFPAPAPGDWRTELLCETLDELGAPWYDVREELARRLAQGGGSIDDFYIPSDEPGSGHYDADGNEAAYAVLLRGLAEQAGLRPEDRFLPAPHAFKRVIGAPGGLATFSKGPSPPFDQVPGDSRLILRARRGAPSAARYELHGNAGRFRARAWAYDPQGAAAPFELHVIVDGVTTQRIALRAGDAPLPLELDLGGANVLELSLAVHSSQGCVVLTDPALE